MRQATPRTRSRPSPRSPESCRAAAAGQSDLRLQRKSSRGRSRPSLLNASRTGGWHSAACAAAVPSTWRRTVETLRGSSVRSSNESRATNSNPAQVRPTGVVVRPLRVRRETGLSRSAIQRADDWQTLPPKTTEPARSEPCEGTHIASPLRRRHPLGIGTSVLGRPSKSLTGGTGTSR